MAFPNAFRTYIPTSHCIPSHVYGAMLVNEFREVALVRGRKSGKWSFPKGHGNTNETPLEASTRELKEETGVDMSCQQPHNRWQTNSGTYFVFCVNGRPELEPEDTCEIMDTMWVSLHRLQHINGNKDITTFCKRVDVEKFIAKNMSR
jgi:ADP-ribose pyrophosphatase YjhB (NUDIX family)